MSSTHDIKWKRSEEQRCKQSSTHSKCSIVQELNSAAETVDCRQLILCVLVAEITSYKTAYDDSSKFFLLLVYSL